jgi:hypothetical protein
LIKRQSTEQDKQAISPSTEQHKQDISAILDFDIDYTKVSEHDLDRQIQRNLCPENMLAHVFGTVSFL